ncbi:MAG: bifunctional methylenetetrahydrofolate dehydrogenase/methenyltetrahydrofolate cyclohydrolase FolD [Candidatus Anstonellaceae archaeon]
MVAKIIDGKQMASGIIQQIAKQVSKLKDKPCLAFVLVGEDSPSMIYANKKVEDCEKAGMISKVVRLPASCSMQKLISHVRKLNEDFSVDGIIVQLPLPQHLDEERVIAEISPQKDVDGFHPINLGKLVAGNAEIFPCTPKGIVYMLKKSKIKLEGKHAVIIGRSRIVGKPLALMLLQENCTVTLCHTKTKDLKKHTMQADIIVVAAGRPHLLKANMVKKGAIVVDVGINRQKGRIVGDVDFEKVSKKASAITPVPGGVGPMTRAMLLENTLQCYFKRRGENAT